MAKLNMKNTVLVVTVFTAIVYVICRVFYVILPRQTVALANNLFQGIEFITKPFDLTIFVVGFIEAVILTAIGAALFVWLYNKIAKK